MDTHTDLLGVLQDKGHSVDVMNIDDVVYYTTDTMKKEFRIFGCMCEMFRLLFFFISSE